ncbi:spore germination protein [Sporolactobacillus sp. KGMB 08714]|uniref:spore germination protein n=1 Tax=Sporolactobacillus sp. KGMB 08714 TaxID=3064704 RepID=UPI002FBDE112
MFWKKKRLKEAAQHVEPKTIVDLYNQIKDNVDFIQFEHCGNHFSCWISFFKTLVDVDYVHRDVLSFLYEQDVDSLNDIQKRLPIEKILKTTDLSTIQYRLLKGYIIIQKNKSDAECLIIPMTNVEGRQIGEPKTETSVMGPKESFVESIDTNINLMRKRLPIPQFRVEEVRIGKISKTRVCTMYIRGIANDENVHTVRQRLQDLEVSDLTDTILLAQLIGDNSQSPFPQFIDSERPDRTATAIYEGQIAVFIDGSPNAIILPSSITKFFSSIDDYFLPWYLATAYRVLRVAAVSLSTLSSSIYVALLTYHYQLIPENLLGPLIASRSLVPFDPATEALILEVMIELLREAGARLPTKVGQTMSIVGGIVIGTASVQAGMTSNVLLIIVSISALGSFIIPNYRMATAIRFLRFPFILSAQLLGLLGIAFCLTFLTAHLLKLTSLGRPFLEPYYPLRVTDLKDTIFRAPNKYQTTRPLFLRPGDAAKRNQNRSAEKRGKPSRDIDES